MGYTFLCFIEFIFNNIFAYIDNWFSTFRIYADINLLVGISRSLYITYCGLPISGGRSCFSFAWRAASGMRINAEILLYI